MKIKYIGPSDEVHAAGYTFPRNHQVDVDDKIAGRPPEPRLAEAMKEHEVARIGGDHQWQRDLKAEIPTLDPGEGLLAQTSSFVAVDKPKKEDDK